MGGRRMADTNASPQEHGHLESPAAHVLHLGDLVDDLADRIEHEVSEHEVHHGPRAGHRRAPRQTHEATFANRRVTQPRRSMHCKQSTGGGKVAAAHTDAFAHDEDLWIARHLFSQRLKGGLHEGEFARGGRGRRRLPMRCACRHSIDVGGGALSGGISAFFSKLMRRFGECRDLLFDGVQLGIACEGVLQEVLFKSSDRASCPPLLHVFPGAVSEVAHALGVRPGAVGLAFDE